MGDYFGLPYDYHSVMHYSSSAFSNCGWGCITIQTLDEKMQSVSITYSLKYNLLFQLNSL